MEMIGNEDVGVHESLKIWFKGAEFTVCSLIGDGSTMSIDGRWESPFEQDTIGSYFGRSGGLLQHEKGITSRTTLNSAQVWEGNSPVQLNLLLHFYTLQSARKEVEDPIKALYEMISPEVNENIPIGTSTVLGQAPSYVTINASRKFIWDKMIITSVEAPMDTRRDSNGDRLNAIVNVTAKSSRMIDRRQIPKMMF